jgi:transcriptional antiterminator NusG
MTDSLKRETLTAVQDNSRPEAPPVDEEKSKASEAHVEGGEPARLPDISIGDVETESPEVSDSPASTEEIEIEIPWVDAVIPATTAEEAGLSEAESEAKVTEPVTPVEATAGEAVAAPSGLAAPFKRAWYVVHCYSGYENKVKKGLEQRINSMGMQDRIFRVVVPIEKEVEIKEGQRRNIERRVFPGYILVEMMELQQGEPVSDEAWYVVRNTPGVTGFVSSGDKPVPLREDEVAKILQRMESEEPKVHVTFRSGQTVHIIDGPFADFRGTVDNVDMTKGKVRVLVSFFGRETPVELDLLQVEKV